MSFPGWNWAKASSLLICINVDVSLSFHHMYAHSWDHTILLPYVLVWSELQHCNLGPFCTGLNVDYIFEPLWPFTAHIQAIRPLTIDCGHSCDYRVYGSDTPSFWRSLSLDVTWVQRTKALRCLPSIRAYYHLVDSWADFIASNSSYVQLQAACRRLALTACPN